ncbi:cellulose binding domain-containing protein [Cellulomonas sp. Leaf334]|uniref:cellulose binding domain-containing protein n=1 Tax=Cellulomonas sp. Leaf334 TaxID=1736339 RepID=UPI0006F33F1E|nr:cellulose binding domain-containing protein [Cellulomonas sp. Leaf334]KQR17290.1 cellulose-binding protein [Cellulomonas sp. Leaf334]
MQRPQRWRRIWPAVLAAATLITAGTVADAPVASAATACRVDYVISSQWSNGFGANVTITNLGDAVSSWRLTWSFSAGQTVTQAWNTNLTQSGSTVSASNASYNGSLGTGASSQFGFNGSLAGANPAPTSFALNGTICNGPVSTPTPTPTATSTPSPTPTATAAAADITVNTGRKYQTIDGFGAAVSIWGGAWSTTDTQTLVGMGDHQLGLSIVRTGISPVSSEWNAQVSALKTAKSYGSEVKILASPWTAPAAWKSNNSRINGGTLLTSRYGDYANHLNSYVQYMRNQGVTIDVTSVQNEPDWHPAYDSMAWTGDTMRNFVRDHGATITNTKLLVAESLGTNRYYSDPTLYDATARNNIGYVGGHIYGQENGPNLSAYPLAAQYGKNQWMTEWNFHEADGNGSNIWGDPSNLAAWNETLDTIMPSVNRTMESNWSAYIWWYGRRYYSFIGDGESAFGTTGGAVLKRGWAFSQYAKYVRPGYQRIGVTESSKASPLDVTAYQGDGTITLVILNRTTNAVNGAVIQAPEDVTSALQTMTSRYSSRAGQTTSVTGSQVKVSVPARSISTVVITL